jgi:hypothetical protein
MQSEKEDAGVMSLLLDTLIDIDDLRDNKRNLAESEGEEGDSTVRREHTRGEEGQLPAVNTAPREQSFREPQAGQEDP